MAGTSDETGRCFKETKCQSRFFVFESSWDDPCNAGFLPRESLLVGSDACWERSGMLSADADSGVEGLSFNHFGACLTSESHGFSPTKQDCHFGPIEYTEG